MKAMSNVAFVSVVFVVMPVIAHAQTKVLPAAAISAAAETSKEWAPLTGIAEHIGNR